MQFHDESGGWNKRGVESFPRFRKRASFVGWIMLSAQHLLKRNSQSLETTIANGSWRPPQTSTISSPTSLAPEPLKFKCLIMYSQQVLVPCRPNLLHSFIWVNVPDHPRIFHPTSHYSLPIGLKIWNHQWTFALAYKKFQTLTETSLHSPDLAQPLAPMHVNECHPRTIHSTFLCSQTTQSFGNLKQHLRQRPCAVTIPMFQNVSSKGFSRVDSLL